MHLLISIFKFLVFIWPVFLFLAVSLGIRGRSGLKLILKSGLVWIFRTWVFLALLIMALVLQGHAPVSLIPEPYNMVLFLVIGAFVSLIRIVLFKRVMDRKVQMKHDLEALEMLRSLEARDFEETIAHYFRKLGNRVQCVGQTADHGIDLEVRPENNVLWVVQCKRYRGSVGEPAIRDLYGTMKAAQAERAYLITSGRFTANALAWAEGKDDLILKDGEGLVKELRGTQTLEWALRFE